MHPTNPTTEGVVTSAGELRPVLALALPKPLACAPVAAPPRVAHLRIDILVVDEGYQRALSTSGIRLIRRIAEFWDWNNYKPLSVAPCGDGRYEVIDGQHTAIGAATNGAIESLPCLVLPAGTIAERARAFVGINRDRVALTPYALFRARVAADDRDAVAVQDADAAADVELRQSFSYYEDAPAGAVSCVSTLLLIQRTCEPGVLARALRIGKVADFRPMSSLALKALANLIGDGVEDAALTEALLAIGPDDLAARAVQRRKLALAPDNQTAAVQVIMAELDRKQAA